jgi:hypothetical protein
MKKPSIDQQIEECVRLMDDLAVSRGVRKSVVEHRQKLARAILATLEFVKESEGDIRFMHKLKKLNPEAWPTARDMVNGAAKVS